MLTQNIKALLLFISAILTILAAKEYYYDIHGYSGFIGSAFISLLASNIVDLIDKWHHNRREFELPTEEKQPWMWRRQAD